MKIKLILLVIFALLSGHIFLTKISAAKLASESDTVGKDPVNSPSIKQTTIDQIEPLIFNPRARGQDEEYTGTGVAAGTFGPGECPDIEPPLTAFVPGDGETSFRSTTAKADPTFWFYVPSPSNSQLSAEFKLMLIDNTTKEPVGEPIFDNKEYKLEPTDEKLTDIFRIQIPKALEFDKNYYWSFTIVCDPNRRDSDIYVDGYVTRVRETETETETFNQSEVLATEQKAIFYADNGLWHETLTTLIEGICPQDNQKAKSLITKLLESESVGLESSAEQYVKTILSSRYCNPNSSQ